MLIVGLFAPLPVLAIEYREAQLSLTLEDGHALAVRLRVPEGAQGRLPAVMLFGGIERGAAALDLVVSQSPMILASFDYPFELPRSASPMTIARLLPEARRAIARTVEGIGQLHAALAARPDVDSAKISLVGVSLGAPFAVIAAADHQVPGLAVIHGFAEVPQVIAHQFIRRREPAPGPVYRLSIGLFSRFMAWFAGIPDIGQKAASLGPGQRVWMLSASDDGLIPNDAIRSLRDGFEQSSAELVFETESGGHLAGGEDPRIPSLLRRAEHWMWEVRLAP